MLENGDTTNTASSAERLDCKPDRKRNQDRDDCAPYHWRQMFRTSASRRVVRGVVEFPVHPRRLGSKAIAVFRLLAGIYRNTARTLSQSDAPSCGFDGDGCVALAGSDAGKLPIRPASSLP